MLFSNSQLLPCSHLLDQAGEVTSTPLPPDAITNTTNTTAPVAAEDIKAAEADTAPVAVAVPEPTYSYSAAGITSPGTRGSRNQVCVAFTHGTWVRPVKRVQLLASSSLTLWMALQSCQLWWPQRSPRHALQIILMPGAGSDITAASDDSAVDYAPMGPTSRGGVRVCYAPMCVYLVQSAHARPWVFDAIVHNNA